MVVWFDSSPTLPLSPKSNLSLFLSLPVSRRSSLLEPIVRPRESLALYKSFNTLCVRIWRLLSWLTQCCSYVQTRHTVQSNLHYCTLCKRTRQWFLGTGSCLDSSVHGCSPSYVSHVHAGHLLHHPRHPHHDIQHLQDRQSRQQKSSLYSLKFYLRKTWTIWMLKVNNPQKISNYLFCKEKGIFCFLNTVQFQISEISTKIT